MGFPDRLLQYSASLDDHEALDNKCNFDHQSNTNFRVKVILEEEIEIADKVAEQMKVLVKQQYTTDACSTTVRDEPINSKKFPRKQGGQFGYTQQYHTKAEFGQQGRFNLKTRSLKSRLPKWRISPFPVWEG